MMNNRETRMEILNANGVNTNKYFCIPEDIREGDKFEVKIDANGNHIVVKCKDSEPVDDVMQTIIDDGYVKNSKLHRRWVMAQMFRALNYDCRWTGNKGFHGFLRDKGYMYSINMMIEECRVLGKLQERDKDTFEERELFFNKKVICETLEHYMVKLESYVNNMRVKNCKGIPYKTINSKNIFVSDIDKKVYAPLRRVICSITICNDYNKMHSLLCTFKRIMVNLPHDTDMSSVFIDAYKGAGAYYTLKNMVMFHECKIQNENFPVHYCKSTDAVIFLKEKSREYKGEGWRMMGLLKKVIKDNNFDFSKRMEELNK